MNMLTRLVLSAAAIAFISGSPLFAQTKARFETTELVEITAAIATYNMVARFLVALGVTPEE